MKDLRSNFVLYPFLFGLYPVLALIAHNANEMDFSSGFRGLLGSLFFTLILFAITLFLTRDPSKAALLTSVFILLFYSYGHINLLARDWMLLGINMGRHRVLLPIYMGLLIVAVWLILRTRRDLSGSTRILNAFALILLMMPLYQIAASLVEGYRARQQVEQNPSGQSLVSKSPDQALPDVYYIVLDGYPRGDFINQYLDSSNLPFLEDLEERGFYVANCSQSNYSDTRFSLASILNMVYLDGGEEKPEVVHSGAVLDEMIRSGEVQQNFTDLGYTIITFESGYKWLRWKSTSHHLMPGLDGSSPLSNLGLNDFERLLLDTTAARLLLDLPLLLQSNQLAEIIDNPRAAHRERVMYSLEQLPRIPTDYASPKFTYAHIIFPHPPFVVDEHGTPLVNAPADELEAYADQIAYLDQRLLKIIDDILESSAPPPVIILQGDHGATIAYQEHGIDPAQRLGILNAYYLPPHSPEDGIERRPDELLYPSISPVNSFRLIFDTYFNAGYGLLEDRSIVGRLSPYTELICSAPR
jgi:hypothetical protein